jgi:hypothetical protein
METKNSSTFLRTIFTTAMNRLRATQDWRVTLREIDFDLNPVFFWTRATLQKNHVTGPFFVKSHPFFDSS